MYTFRVADYGFTKLIELFEAIPTTIEITEDVDGERILQLTDSERLKVVGDHIGFLIKHHSVVVKRRGKVFIPHLKSQTNMHGILKTCNDKGPMPIFHQKNFQ